MNGSTGPRLVPVPRDAWDDDAVAALQRGFGGLPPDPVPNVVGTLLHHPRLAGAFLAYNTMLLRAPALDPRARELMILRVAWRTTALYEWLQHVRIAERLGVTDDEIAAVGVGPSAPTWTGVEADLLAATDQLIDHYRIDDGTWARLAEHLSERELVEVVFVVGTYTCLAMAFNSFGLELDADLVAMRPPAMPTADGA